MKFSYDEMERDMREWIMPAGLDEEYNWMGVMRSGVIVAGMLASLKRKHFGVIDPYTKEILIPFKYDPKKPFLVIDDTSGQTGKTWRRCANILNGFKFETLFYLFDPKHSLFEPDFYIRSSTDWVDFPWDNDPEGAYEWKKDW